MLALVSNTLVDVSGWPSSFHQTFQASKLNSDNSSLVASDWAPTSTFSTLVRSGTDFLPQTLPSVTASDSTSIPFELGAQGQGYDTAGAS